MGSQEAKELSTPARQALPRGPKHRLLAQGEHAWWAARREAAEAQSRRHVDNHTCHLSGVMWQRLRRTWWTRWPHSRSPRFTLSWLQLPKAWAHASVLLLPVGQGPLGFQARRPWLAVSWGGRLCLGVPVGTCAIATISVCMHAPRDAEHRLGLGQPHRAHQPACCWVTQGGQHALGTQLGGHTLC